ncbi:VC0807 family protein [Actinomadura gamaensis]|uniref:VC0807 family protein n=1 Tax=Actinomadura gamaensis TaxID=1763541 RepID=A0ABV9UB77_9ACTN
MAGARQGGSPITTIVPAIVFNVVLPFASYSLLTGHGVSPVRALLLISLWPAADTLAHLVLKRRVDEFGVMMLVLMLLGALSAVAYNTTELFFLKDSAITGLLGLTYLGSLALPKPIMFYLGRKFATDGSAERLAWWNGLWQHAEFRRTQYRLTIVWGAAFLLEAAVRIPLTYLLPTGVMVLMSTVMPMAVVAALVTWTIRVGKQSRARGAAREAAAREAATGEDVAQDVAAREGGVQQAAALGGAGQGSASVI